jgi:hypothetical protein
MASLILALIGLLVLLPGCAVLERHPVSTAVGTAIIAGSIAAAVQHHHDQQHERRIAPSPTFDPICAPFCAVQ